MTPFSLTLFSTQPEFIQRAVRAGVAEVIVDWERKGKAERQASADTEIRRDTLADLERVRKSTTAKVLCRINRLWPEPNIEIERAIAAGADEILLPMVQSVDEVVAALDQVAGRCGVGILVETTAALEIVGPLAALPLSRVYIGLNDLAIQRGHTNIFSALADGLVEQIRRDFVAPFGFGGLTLPDRGHPVPCRLLMGEMARLHCAFSFLRRSFHRDVQERDLNVEVPRILTAMHRAQMRSAEQIAADRQELGSAIRFAYADGERGRSRS